MKLRLVLTGCAFAIISSGCVVAHKRSVPVRHVMVHHEHDYDAQYYKPYWQKLAEAEEYRQRKIEQERLFREKLWRARVWQRQHNYPYPPYHNQNCHITRDCFIR